MQPLKILSQKVKEMDKFDLPVDYTKLNTRQRKLVREQYVEKQKGRCSVCDCGLNNPANTQGFTINKALFPVGFFNNPIHLHHNHKTGMTLGAVHAECNAIRWQYFGE